MPPAVPRVKKEIRDEEEESDIGDFDVGDGNESGQEELVGDPAEDGYQRNAFKPMKPSAAFSYSIQNLITKYKAGQIDLDPEYQRDVVWKSGKQPALIRSVLTNTHIPPLLFNKTPGSIDKNGDRFEKWTCVDGKQRLSSILAFEAGKIAVYPDEKTGVRFWHPNAGQKTLSEDHSLSPFFVNKFNKRILTCVLFEEMTIAEEHKMFLTVQMGMPLTPAEKLKAIRGPMQNWIRMIDDYFFEGILSGVIKMERAATFRLVGCSMIQIETLIRWRDQMTDPDGMPQMTWSPGRLEKWLKANDCLRFITADLQKRVWRAWDTVAALRKSHREIFGKLEGLKVPNLSPIELYGIVCIVAYYPGRPMGMLVKDIQTFRKDIRRQHKDLQSNMTLWKSIWHFIDNTIPEHLGVAEDNSQWLIPSERHDEKGIRTFHEKRLRKIAEHNHEALAADSNHLDPDQWLTEERIERERDGTQIPRAEELSKNPRARVANSTPKPANVRDEIHANHKRREMEWHRARAPRTAKTNAPNYSLTEDQMQHSAGGGVTNLFAHEQPSNSNSGDSSPSVPSRRRATSTEEGSSIVVSPRAFEPVNKKRAADGEIPRISKRTASPPVAGSSAALKKSFARRSNNVADVAAREAERRRQVDAVNSMSGGRPEFVKDIPTRGGRRFGH